MIICHVGPLWGLFGTHGGPKRAHLGPKRPIWAPKGPSGPQKALLGARRGPGGPEETLYKVKVLGNHDSNPVRPIGSSWDQFWPLWGAQKLFSQLGTVWGQMGPFGAPVGA